MNETAEIEDFIQNLDVEGFEKWFSKKPVHVQVRFMISLYSASLDLIHDNTVPEETKLFMEAVRKRGMEILDDVREKLRNEVENTSIH